MRIGYLSLPPVNLADSLGRLGVVVADYFSSGADHGVPLQTFLVKNGKIEFALQGGKVPKKA